VSVDQKNSMLSVNNLTVWRGDNLLLDKISFALNSGDVLQIKGANGSGKTTLLRVTCGVGIADEGEVYWNGIPIHKSRDQFNDALLYLGHKPGIKGGLTAIENLRIFATLSGYSQTKETDRAIESALDALSLTPKSHIACRYLSAGQQRRVGLARLLLRSSHLWVLDEPLTSLDAAGLMWVEAQIGKHAANGGAVLLTTHVPLNIDAVTVDTLELG